MLPFLIGAAVGVAGSLGSKILSDVFYTTKEASVLLDISEYTVRKKIRDGELKAEVIPGKAGYRINKTDLNDYLERRRRLKSIDASDDKVEKIFLEKLAPPEEKNENVFVDSMMQLDKAVINNPNAKKVSPELLRGVIAGKETDLKGLRLRLKMLELDDDDSIEFKKKKLQLEIDINDLEAEIQAYKVSELAFHEMKKDSAAD